MILTREETALDQSLRDNFAERHLKPAASEQPIDFEALLAIARRQWRAFTACVAVAVVFGLLYAFTAVPLYTATTSLLIDRGNDSLVTRLTMDELTTDESAILSQIEVLKSDSVGLAVIDKLGLAKNGVFMADTVTPLGTLKGLVTSLIDISQWFAADEAQKASEDERRDALARLEQNIDITRSGRSYVLNVSYTSPSPELAAEISNGIVEAYILDKLDAKYDATRRASSWLQDRIDELRQKALDSDLAVEKFRADNNLLSTGGQLITDQQLGQLTSALLTARADAERAKAKYDQITDTIASGKPDAMVNDALDSTVFNQLRQKYVAASKLESEISSRLGTNHVRAVRLREEMQEYDRLMTEELSRIAQSYKSDYDVARSRETTLENTVAEARKASTDAGTTSVQLRELERASDTYKNLYQTFLQRYQEAIQQQSFPITEARVITRPVKPDTPTYPKKTLVLAIFAGLGALFGLGLGSVREMRDKYLRTGQHVRDYLQQEFLGYAPFIQAAAADKSDMTQAGLKADPGPQPGAASGEPANRTIQHLHDITNHAILHPFSAFAETLRSVKIATGMHGPKGRGKVVGFVSTFPGEGKTTLSINFAEILAMQGAKTLLIDCDLRNPGATRAIARQSEQGLVEAITEGRDLAQLMVLDPQTRLAFIPAVVRRRIPHSAELLSGQAMQAILEKATSLFDYVILDLPPIAPVVDARAIAPLVDEFVYVVQWGKTSQKSVRSAIATDPEIQSKCTGVILNKVDNKQMKLYRAFGSTEYYYSRYATYYHD